MKRIVLAFLCLPLVGLAQPTVNSFTPVFGDSIHIHSFSTPFNLSFPKTGNQTWNFGSEPQTPRSFSAVMANPATLPHAASFPNANFGQMVINGGSVMAILYGKITADSIWGMGVRYPGMPVLDEDYINPNVSYRFPWNLNGIIADISESSNGDIDTTELKYVAWGSITTPYGTYNNAVLAEESRMVNGVLTLESYRWVDVATLSNILEVYADDSTGDWYVFQSATSVGQEALFEKYRFSVYPNPSHTLPNIEYNLPAEANVAVDIMSVNGQNTVALPTTKQGAGAHKLSLNQHALSAGTYFVRLTIDGKPMVKRFTIH